MSATPRLAMVITTVETMQQATSLADQMIAASLAACVQIDGPITTLYRWDGKLERTQEFRLMIKTTLAAWPAVQQLIRREHAYQTPELIMMEISDASLDYHDWVIQQTQS